jgi:TPR repeat protein
LRRAVLLNSSQACYELGTCLYTGIEEVMEEDPEGAFALFQKAASQDHTGGLYMAADCLAEGEGTEKNVADAVPLFYRAADQGHRHSRQRIRELLANKEYQS